MEFLYLFISYIDNCINIVMWLRLRKLIVNVDLLEFSTDDDNVKNERFVKQSVISCIVIYLHENGLASLIVFIPVITSSE